MLESHQAVFLGIILPSDYLSCLGFWTHPVVNLAT